MNDFQVAYTVALVALTFPAWGRQRYVLLCLWGNLVATLAACLAMDLDALSRADATLTMLVIDTATGAALAIKPGLSRIVAWGYAITIPIYAVNVAFGVSIVSTYGYIYIAAATQLGVFAIGCNSNLGNGGGGRRGRASRALSLAISRRNKTPSGSVASRVIASNRVRE